VLTPLFDSAKNTFADTENASLPCFYSSVFGILPTRQCGNTELTSRQGNASHMACVCCSWHRVQTGRWNPRLPITSRIFQTGYLPVRTQPVGFPSVQPVPRRNLQQISCSVLIADT
jgi:hypothetical protein